MSPEDPKGPKSYEGTRENSGKRISDLDNRTIQSIKETVWSHKEGQKSVITLSGAELGVDNLFQERFLVTVANLTLAGGGVVTCVTTSFEDPRRAIGIQRNNPHLYKSLTNRLYVFEEGGYTEEALKKAMERDVAAEKTRLNLKSSLERRSAA